MREITFQIAKSPEFFEYVANHPRVQPFVSEHGDPPMVFSRVWHTCIGFQFERGGWIAQKLAPHRYEIHTLFLPHSPGVRDMAAQVRWFLFVATDAEELVTQVPADLPHVHRLSQDMGFRDRFRREAAWLRKDGPVAVDHLSVRIDDWILADDALAVAGITDPCESRYVGFAGDCEAMNMPEKGAAIYNRWAAWAHKPLRTVTRLQEDVSCRQQASLAPL